MAKKAGGKGGSKSSNLARKGRRQRSWARCNGFQGKKDKRVEKSSHGKFKDRAALAKTRVEAAERNTQQNTERMLQMVKGYKYSWTMIEHENSIYNRIIHPEPQRGNR